MADQSKKRRQEPDVHQPIKEEGHEKRTVKPGQKVARPEEKDLRGRESEGRR
jgi:hypothetical protein